MNNRIITLTTAALAATLMISSPALAGKIHEVNMVQDGIDLSHIIVRATPSGYTGYRGTAHKYLLRVFAKAGGSNRIVGVKVTADTKSAFMEVSQHTYYHHKTPNNNGWGVYTKHITPIIKYSDTVWKISPKKACLLNMKNQMNHGKSKSYVLDRSWEVMAKAFLSLHAGAASKAKTKPNLKIGTVETKSKAIYYTVLVTCEHH